MEKECLFCKIINKEIDSTTIYEDDNVIAILDLYPADKGHTLIIPKKHYSSFLTINIEQLNFINIGAKNVCEKIIKKLDAKGFNIITNVNSIAQQSILHYHLHIIPKYQKDEGFILPNSNYKQSENEFKILIEKLKN